MADLLEALVQIRALAETPARIAAVTRDAEPARWAERPSAGVWAPVEVLAHLADAELVFALRLRLMLAADAPVLPALAQDGLAARAAYIAWPPALALARFTTRRAETSELLASCSAADLERTGTHPLRGTITVADLVALMLAHDTDHVAQIRARLGLLAVGGPRRPGPLR